VEYHEIVAWGKLGELANQYLSKGRKVMVIGRLQTQSWEKDGVKRQRTEIVASDINFLDGPQSGGNGGGDYTPASSGSSAPAPSAEPVIEDLGDDAVNLDDIPF
jgi:single-strand DNA-binding protein